MKFGPYQIVEKLGTGSMGMVYRAVHEDGGGEVALKILKSRKAASPDAVEAFRNEAKIAASLQHPNIVPIHTFGQAEGKYYYTMGFIEGDPLTRLIDDDVITPEESVKLVVAVADALDYAHMKGVVHGDIKPANILIDPSSRPLISDFGLARQSASIEEGGGVLLEGRGTPAYMSPEQAQGREVTKASDLFSLGAVLYELLTGRPPYEGSTADDVVMKAAKGVFKKPSDINPVVPAPLESVVLKAMRRDPEERYASASDMRRDLEKYLKGENVSASNSALFGPLASKIASPRNLAAAAFAMAAFVPFLVPFALRNAGAPSRESVRTERMVRHRIDAAREYLKKDLRTAAEAQFAAAEDAANGTLAQTLLDIEKHDLMDNRRIIAEQLLSKVAASLKSNDLAGAEEAMSGFKALRIEEGGILERAATLGGKVASARRNADEDRAAYAAIKKASAAPADRAARAAALQKYLDKFPSGSRAREAKAELEKMFPLYLPGISLGPTGRNFFNAADRAELVFVPAGGFIMGSDMGYSDEKPEHRPVLDSFYIYKYEVTNRTFALFLNSLKSAEEVKSGRIVDPEAMKADFTSVDGKWAAAPGREDHPAVNVTWFGAEAYSRWAGAQLPTEAQWEKAARGEGGNVYPWGLTWERKNLNSLSLWADRDLDARWFDTIGVAERIELLGKAATTPTGRFVAGMSAFGCYDMSGNVWEWCRDSYDRGYYSSKSRSQLNPLNNFDSGQRVLRGGSFMSAKEDCRSSQRKKKEPGSWYRDIGFRCVRDSS